MFERKLNLPKTPSESFFLWGPRQVGKSTLLKSTYPDAVFIDLLKSETYRQFSDRPETLRELLAVKSENPLVIIDEVQKVPALLDEVHWVIENRNIRFALCGSSARKLKRGHANMLGGRAVRYELYGLVSAELEDQFNLEKILNQGYIPRHYLSSKPLKLLEAYVSDYLKEEIAAEGIVRNLPVFSRFLDIASLSDAELVSFATIARECGVSAPTIKEYFQILVDTLLGSWLPAYTIRPKRKIISAPKFYFSDIGVVNFLGKRRNLEPGSQLFGKAFENWVFHELKAYQSYAEKFTDFSYWRLSSGAEVDFIINSMEVAIEAKASKNISSDYLKNLRELRKDHPEVKKQIVVCLESEPRMTEDQILILPVKDFCKSLWGGQIF